MKTHLTEEQIHHYQEKGFLIHRNFLDPEEVAELRSAVLETMDKMGDQVLADNADFKTKEAMNKEDPKVDADKEYGRVFTQRINLHRINDTVRDYVLRPELGEMISRMSGIDALRVWHDQALFKEPYGNPTAWHLDDPFWSFYSPSATTIWIALEDATLENGCMWFIPGTHKIAGYEKQTLGPNLDLLFRQYPKMAEIDPVPAPMKAGDCSFHNGLTAHGAGANMTRKRRMALTCAYMPAGATFNGRKNVLPTDYFESLKEGDTLENDDWNPLV